jgi:putative hemolysin
MSKQMIQILSVVLALLLGLAGCQKATQTKTPESNQSLANPASVYCQGLGFSEETRTNQQGQYGVCLFPDGNSCDSWDFLAGRCGEAHSYCAQQGYTLQTNESNIATCVFPDGSTCDEYAYFQAECQPGENPK